MYTDRTLVRCPGIHWLVRSWVVRPMQKRSLFDMLEGMTIITLIHISSQT
jgi:hypothetical protein